MQLPGTYTNGFAPRDGEPRFPSLWDGCVGAWSPSLGPTGLVLRDHSGYGNHGTLTNMDPGTDWVASQGRHALDFDGTNDRIDYAYSNAHETTSGAGWSVGGWANPRDVSSGVANTLVNRGPATTSGSAARDYIIYAGVSSQWSVQNSDGINFPTIIGGTATLNVWQHVFATCTRQGDAILYVNGVSVGTGTLRTNVSVSPLFFSIGAVREAAIQYFFNGLIDDIRVYNRVLSANEVRLLATRRGVAYELAPKKKHFTFAVPAPVQRTNTITVRSAPVPGTYANGFAPRDAEPLYPELWDGCVGAWAPSLGPTGLVLRDHSGFGNHGTLTNMDPGTDWVTSQGKHALDFDGVNDHVANNNVKHPLGNADLSVSFWIKWNATQSDYRLPFGLGTDAFGGQQGYFIWRSNSGFPRAEFGSGTGEALSSVAIGNDVWTHLTGTYDRVKNRLFVNGILQAEISYSGANITGQRVYFGAIITGYFTNCQMSDVALYNRALSPNEIRLLATRRGVAYETASRRPRSVQAAAAFKAYWANRRSQMIGGGVK